MAAMGEPVYAPGVAVAEHALGGVACVVCRPEGVGATMLYFHGGGYRLGSARYSAAFGSRLAVAARARVVVVDYRLAPEQPFPAAVHDAVATYQALLDEGTSDIVVVGDSAGGGLAAALVVGARDADVPSPRGLVLISPWLDLTVTSDTYASRSGSDQLFSRQSASDASSQYLQGHDATDPLASPSFADLTGFPPCLVFAGGDEVLLGDAIAFSRSLALAGVSVETHIVAGMQHVWPTLFPQLDESTQALDAMARFVGRVVAGAEVG
jgi:acetyl esterase/lipase